MKDNYTLDGLTYYPETGVFLWTDSKCTRINSLNTKATGYDKLPSGNYRARLQVEGKRVGLGTFQNPEDARKAYEKAKGDYLESNL